MTTTTGQIAPIYLQYNSIIYSRVHREYFTLTDGKMINSSEATIFKKSILLYIVGIFMINIIYVNNPT